MIEKIKAYIASSISDLQPEEIDVHDDLLGSGIIDSLGMMKLVVFIEAELNVKIPDADMVVEHFMTLGSIMDYLSKREDVHLNQD
ncbi:acyl carrier protein [Pricia sp.]|uniref:acyl carrier protein n=1 Tax=Pricia sp. TaxID=2268138 RepID=UPI003593A88A